MVGVSMFQRTVLTEKKFKKTFSSSDELFDKEFGIYDDTIDNDVNYIWDKNGDIKKEDILKRFAKKMNQVECGI
ncbi:MAG: hypothetical protein L6V91_06740 [Bacilli bacterium]|nr:MAG: hypothetical protein L6V91_06740 [Bacilli bacterium]